MAVPSPTCRPGSKRASGSSIEREGVETGIDLQALVDATGWIETQLGRPLPGRVFRALGGGRVESG